MVIVQPSTAWTRAQCPLKCSSIEGTFQLVRVIQVQSREASEMVERQHTDQRTYAQL